MPETVEISGVWVEKLILISLTHIVLFRFLESTSEMVLFVTGNTYDRIEGKIIAYSELNSPTSGVNVNWKSMTIFKRDIQDYRIYTKRELPLLMGYQYTTPLLAELLKGD